jgi:branched-chain amino acid transport system substrate-binding protein
MWEGINAAFTHSPQLERLRKLFQLRTYDDGSLESEAEKIGREIQSDPRVLAVIGHASSGTTRSAAWLYAQAGMPVIMPIATSPYAVYPPGSNINSQTRLRNCFRLPPSDDRVQAPTVAFVAEEKLKAKRIYLLRDISEGASEYSEPLYKKLESLLGNISIDKQSVDRGHADFREVASNIEAQHPDLVVFCGYGSTATLILSALRHVYQDNQANKPKILLTDGSRIRDLNASDFDVYLTFPLPEISSFNNCPSEDNEILRSVIQPQTEQSFQVYGYDAMLLIGKALEKCSDEEISRDCLRRGLSELPLFTGSTCLQYFFAEGDNTLSDYYVFHSVSSSGEPGIGSANSSPIAKPSPSARTTSQSNQTIPSEDVNTRFSLEYKVTSQDLDRYLSGKGMH